ncbi:DNA translocase FtsK 4TM domain-containing protein [Candidatus Uhrbacteria bacterium]|nr:DNA translocase FtsK 4TM domain-containing protein [Candidatus Uhrbacteria bacterium]
MSRRRRGFKFPDLHLDPETAHGILTVVIFAVAAFILLSEFDLAGSVGVSVDQALAHVLGWDRIVLPFFLFAVGIHLVTPEKFPLKGTNYVGFILFFLSLNPFIQVANPQENVGLPEKLATMGGKLGSLMGEPIVGLLGRLGAGIFFFALFVISLLLIFNTSLKRVVQILNIVFGYLKRILLALLVPFRWVSTKRIKMKDEKIRAETVRASEPRLVTPEPIPVASKKVSETEEDEEDEDEDVVPLKPHKRQPKVEVPFELLTKRDQKPTSGDIQRNQYVIQRTLETFGIPVEMGDVAVGPTVTQFTLKPSEGIKLSRITALHNDLALALAAHPIRIEAPIPGKSLVGLEVPNQSVATVGMREMLESKEWRERRDHLAFALGRDVTGKPWIPEVGKMPHMLVAGATGSGKSVCLNTLIISLLYSYGPDDLKFIMVDPKRVELQVYNGIPHLVTPVITDVDKTVNSLKWALREMDRRFDVLSKFGARDIGSYNARSQEKLPYLVIIVDELADLMVTAMSEVEGPIVRLAQMARAVGIHLVLATQRPSVDVLTGLIKANIPARIAFAVASSTDSRTILDSMGAEKLIGRGDMLFQTSDMASPKRIQGCFVADDEIGRVVEYLKSKYDPADYDPSVVEGHSNGGGTSMRSGIDEGDSDALLPEAKEEIIRAGKASASLLQRRLKVGYARAARILDLLEQEGFIGPGDGAKPREILKVEFTKGMDQIPAASASHPALEQVDREIPEIEED